MMELQEALLSLGVKDNTLSDDEKSFLDENGFLILNEAISQEEVAAFRSRFKELMEEEGENAGSEGEPEEGTLRFRNLVDKGPVFEKCLTHPKVLAAIRHVLGPDFKLSSLNSRDALPGEGHQRLHSDWDAVIAPGDYRVCNTAWLLDDFTAENGATRVVPGTHKMGKIPADVMEDPMADHPDQIQAIAKAGTVLVFNSHTWHGGVTNQTDKPRRAMMAYFSRRDMPQQTNQKESLSQETLARLSPQARVILDVEEV